MKQWKNILGLVIIVVSVIMDWHWAWGIMFFIWFLQGIQHEETTLFEGVTKRESPILYWVILLMWLGMALYSLSWLMYDGYY